jgi:hypothetical protein
LKEMDTVAMNQHRIPVIRAMMFIPNVINPRLQEEKTESQGHVGIVEAC